MEKSSSFRDWVYQLWMQNCDEHDTFHEDQYTAEKYFQKYKYWLKREYKFQNRKK